ncbi:olfactory receptor 6F1-like [Leptodactylus fuscus]|uniref:olfactory receptor 6F1-like n=1 Tax=Leptodactylus fuscus TaxID=238119 RepID=UPI003F4EF851
MLYLSQRITQGCSKNLTCELSHFLFFSRKELSSTDKIKRSKNLFHSTTMVLSNNSDGFLFMEFHYSPTLQFTFFSILLHAYSITVIGNCVIIYIISTNRHLHLPMYFFLINLSILDILFTTTITPKFLSLLANGSGAISYSGCMIQCYSYFFLGATEILILTVMSFDRFMAICYPLRYMTILSPRLCLYLALGSWACAFVDTIAPTVLVIHLSFCGSNRINHFFCDVDELLKLACTDTQYLNLLNFLVSALIVFGSLILIIVSYLNIIIAILKIPSSGGRWKSFTTCSSHILVVFIFYIGTVFMSLRSIKSSRINFNKLSVILSTIITPLLNPFIYTLRNEQVKNAVRKNTTCPKTGEGKYETSHQPITYKLPCIVKALIVWQILGL